MYLRYGTLHQALNQSHNYFWKPKNKCKIENYSPITIKTITDIVPKIMKTVTIVLTWLQINSLAEEPLSCTSASIPPGAIITLGARDIRLLLIRRWPPIMHRVHCSSFSNYFLLELYFCTGWMDQYCPFCFFPLTYPVGWGPMHCHRFWDINKKKNESGIVLLSSHSKVIDLKEENSTKLKRESYRIIFANIYHIFCH